jgi:hypothetical protein
MLWQKLLGTNAAGGLEFVGGVALSSSATQTPSFSLTGLSGGLASAPSSGDIVIACVAFNNSTDRNIQVTTSGYTEVADLYSNRSQDGQLGVYYKVLTGADTSVAFDLGVSVGSFFVCHVWRNINSTPLDATTTTAIDSGGVPVNSPAITTTRANAIVIAVGAAGLGTSASAPTVPSGMENLFQIFTTGSSGAAGIAIASAQVASPSTYDPPAFGGFSTSSGSGWCAATLALRPK